MNILVMGLGYVGMTSALVFAELGWQVTGLDPDESRIAALKEGTIPFYEPGLDDLLAKHTSQGNIRFGTDPVAAIRSNEIIFICVGTPSTAMGEADLRYIRQAAQSIGEHMQAYKLVVIKSTVPIGTWKKTIDWIRESQSVPLPFDVVSNPEFLREGSALSDALHPDRIVIGSDNEAAVNQVQAIYARMNSPVLVTEPDTAEMIKYASNALLAAKISFMNELSRLCDRSLINVNDVAKGMALDPRIGPHFLQAGIGYGGSCFPKDVQALLHTAKARRVRLPLLKQVARVNQNQPLYALRQLERQLGTFHGKTITVLGIAFKPHTDDTREAPALCIITQLLEQQASVQVHDPVAKLPPGMASDQLAQYDAIEQALEQADAVIVCTEWPQYVDGDWQAWRGAMRGPVVLDGRNALDSKRLTSLGYRYLGIGYRRSQT